MGKTLLRLLFNLHPGEGRKVTLFIILGLLWSVGSYGTFVLSEGMFLEHVGAGALPKVYLAIALCMCLLSATLIICLNRLSIHFLLFALIAFWVICNTFFLLSHDTFSSTQFYWYFFKIIGWIIPISTYIVFWAFVDQYYDLQDGKRFFCLFNSMTFLGDALAGGLTSSLISSIGFCGLIIVFSVFLIASLPFIAIITRSLPSILEEHKDSIHTTSSINLHSIFNTIFKSKFTLYLIAFYFMMQLLAIVTEFNYMDTFARTFSNTTENRLTEFIGSCGMWISLGNMVFGMFVYSRIVKKSGVNNLILIAPSFFLTIFSVWFFKDLLPVAIFGMIAREGIVYSLDDNNLNLLLSGVPIKIKNQVRVAVESFIEPTGMFTAAILLVVLQTNSHLLGIIIALVALTIVVFLRSHYPNAIFQNLVASALRFEKKAGDYLKQFSAKEQRQAEFLLLSNLKNSGEKDQLIAYEYLLQIGQLRILPRLLNHIGKLSLPGKLKAFELLSESRWAKEQVVLERLERWRRILPHPEVKSSIHFYLAQHGTLRPEKIMHDLHNDHLGLRAAAIFTLKINPISFQFPTFNSLANEKLRHLLESKHEQEICIGLKILGLEQNTENIKQLLPYLNHPTLSVNREAAKAIRAVAHPDQKEYASVLIEKLGSIRDHDVRLYCLQALEILQDPDSVKQLILASSKLRPIEFKYVERTILKIDKDLSPILVPILLNRYIPDRCRLLACKILGKLNLKTLQNNFLNIAEQEIKRAHFYFYHAHTVQDQVPEHDLSVLQRALFTSYEAIVDFIIQLFGISGSINDCEILSLTLRSQNRKIQAQAIETLEKSCDSRLFSLLEPLIDKRQPERKINDYLKKGGVPLNLTQLLDAMTHSTFRGDQIISLAMKARLNTPNWRQAVREKLQGTDEVLHHFAQELLEEYTYA